MPGKKTLRWICVLALGSLLSACAAAGPAARPMVDNPKELVAAFEGEVAGARNRQVNILAPGWFEKADRALADARRGFEAQAAVSKIADTVARGREDLGKAEEMAAVSRTALADLLPSREAARKAGAARLAAYEDTEADFLRLTRAIEQNNLGYAIKNKERVKAAYHDLEIAAIKGDALGEARELLGQLDAIAGRKHAPQTTALAFEKYDQADRFISQNPYASEKMNLMARDALFHANRALQITRQALAVKEMTPEEVALWVEELLQRTTRQLSAPDMRAQSFQVQQENIISSIQALQENRDYLSAKTESLKNEVDELSARVINLEGRSREEQEAMARLEAERRLDQKFTEIQTFFRKDEAEVYRQGDYLMIRLRGIKFPVGRAVIMPVNYELLRKVQQAIRNFDDPDVVVAGHTDSTGSTAVNEQLSLERAEAVREYLIANNIVPPNRVAAVGYGSERPLLSNETAAGRAANRRIDVAIAPRAKEAQP
jgi:outer membrane protein OmpA-like peptidoglycan-associated protein